MCGIMGEYSSELITKLDFKKLLELSKNRGPDMSGYYIGSNIQFGFNRLSIIDKSKNGNQPIVSPSGRYVIMCNGEIINYKDIQNYCSINNSRLRSSSDIEIFAHAIDKLGFYKLVEMIRGMYAISIYDNKKNDLHLLRDPAGIKPIYFAKIDTGWIFASQYDQIFKHPKYKLNIEINQNSLTEYLKLGYIPPPNALYKNSWMLKPGHYITINNKYMARNKAYYIIDENPIYQETKSSTIDLLINELESSFLDYLNCDVSLATFLSGGVDSPLVNAIISTKYKDLKAFTISSTHSNIDESIYAEKISNYLKLNQQIESFEFGKVNDWLSDHFRAFSEPFADYSSLPTYMLCKHATKYYTVLISGDGADELFWGYPRFLSTLKYKNWFRYPKRLRLLLASLLRRTGIRISSGIESKKIGDWVLDRQSATFLTDVNNILPNAKYSSNLIELFNAPKPSCNSIVFLNWLRKNEFYGHLQRILLKVDRASMAHSLEVRVPFLDRKIIDFSSKILPELGKLHNSPKYLLKQALERYIPKELYLKEKQGFSIDLSLLLKNELKEEIRDIFNSSDFYPFNTMNVAYIKDKVNYFYKNNNENPWSIWTLYSLQKFHENHHLN